MYCNIDQTTNKHYNVVLPKTISIATQLVSHRETQEQLDLLTLYNSLASFTSQLCVRLLFSSVVPTAAKIFNAHSNPDGFMHIFYCSSPTVSLPLWRFISSYCVPSSSLSCFPPKMYSLPYQGDFTTDLLRPLHVDVTYQKLLPDHPSLQKE